jgi:hypothetical protein
MTDEINSGDGFLGVSPSPASDACGVFPPLPRGRSAASGPHSAEPVRSPHFDSGAGLPWAAPDDAGSEHPAARADSPVDVGARSQLWRTAVHEAGHCVTDRLLGFTVAGVTVVAGPGYAGLTWGPASTRALRGKAAYDDDDGEIVEDDIAPRIAAVMASFLPAPGESREGSYDIFANTQGQCVALMAGYAAEMTFLGDIVPGSIDSDVEAANQLAKVICRSAASRSAFLEHAYQEAVALVKEYKAVILAIADVLVDRHTLNTGEIDEVITAAVNHDTAADRAGRAAWRSTVERAGRDPRPNESLSKR